MSHSTIDIKAFIRSVPDFPHEGILFRDITPLLHEPAAYRYAIEQLVERIEPWDPTAVVGIESRGFLLGAPVALQLGLPFVPVRRAGKLPAERMSIEYALEYGEGQLDIHVDALMPEDRPVIVDDLLATGGTCEATARLAERLGASVCGCAFVVELAALGGRERLSGYGVASLVQYD
jgi:adenine phosphoribosyltransferase